MNFFYLKKLLPLYILFFGVLTTGIISTPQKKLFNIVRHNNVKQLPFGNILISGFVMHTILFNSIVGIKFDDILDGKMRLQESKVPKTNSVKKVIVYRIFLSTGRYVIKPVD